MREITSHLTSGKGHNIQVLAVGESGSGNANRIYKMRNEGSTIGEVYFQDGPINEVGVNGVSNEALLAIVIDRLQCFQTSKFSCRENSIALTKLEEAMHWLKHRTESRMSRGVEGSHQV